MPGLQGRARGAGRKVLGPPTHEELIRLRINLFTVIQKTERLAIAVLTLAQKERNAIYSDAEINAARIEVRHAQTMACGAAQSVLSELEALTKTTPLEVVT